MKMRLLLILLFSSKSHAEMICDECGAALCNNSESCGWTVKLMNIRKAILHIYFALNANLWLDSWSS